MLASGHYNPLFSQWGEPPLSFTGRLLGSIACSSDLNPSNEIKVY